MKREGIEYVAGVSVRPPIDFTPKEHLKEIERGVRHDAFVSKMCILAYPLTIVFAIVMFKVIMAILR
jgi:hypothetical protein